MASLVFTYVKCRRKEIEKEGGRKEGGREGGREG